MQIHLVIPGLLWPGASLTNPAEGLELPALARLLGLGQRRVRDFEPLERQLARILGLAPGADEEAPLPLAALRRLGESSGAVEEGSVDGGWLCADPVNLSFAREHLLLHDFPADELSGAEVDALIETLNDVFQDLGRFEACTSTRWYLRLAKPTSVKLFPLHDVIGRPIRHYLPEGDDARLWRRTMNEAQVLLHNHPINQAREAAGRRPLNSLWFWGAGALNRRAIAAPPVVQSLEPLARGLARAGAVEPMPPDVASALQQDTIVVLDTLLPAARQLDLDAWRANLASIEHDWFAPLATALRAGRLQSLTLTAPGDRNTLELQAHSGDRWKFWRKPHAFEALLASLATAVAPASDSTALRPER
ncbi:MAG: hypothetical protein ROZ37_15335 [Aromatoleum sp.]|jgi:hypothetical protein|uniref:hypothetical protein n=1 Tax=Aromatoleum sp. TaxID=2307007 RepID=UPI0028953A09|nr:hypothetical protein [Aromatoleum sp.]MDT3671694.1 hypothetical protein [Aromatoleum sp.]